LDLVEWSVGLIISGVAGAVLGIAFLQPFLSGLVPNRVRFASFRLGKKLRLRKPQIDIESETRIEIHAEEPVAWPRLQGMMKDALPTSASFDDATRRFAFQDQNGIRYELSVGHEDHPSQIDVSVSLGSLKPNEIGQRLLVSLVQVRGVVDALNGLEAGRVFRAIDTYSIRGKTSWQPDLIQFIRTAVGGKDQSASISMIFSAGTEDFPISFEDSFIRATGNLGSESFLARLKSVLSVYV
jgi:hypothetical protein